MRGEAAGEADGPARINEEQSKVVRDHVGSVRYHLVPQRDYLELMRGWVRSIRTHSGGGMGRPDRERERPVDRRVMTCGNVSQLSAWSEKTSSRHNIRVSVERESELGERW